MSSVGTRGAGAVAGTRGFVFFLARAGEMFASKEGCRNDGHILRLGDVVFFRGSTQLDWTMWGQVDRVEVRFRSLKVDQLRDGTVMTRARADPPLPLRDGGGVVELMIELLASCMFLPSHAPLAAFGTARDNWSVWTQARATVALRRVVALAGLPADECLCVFSSHSFCTSSSLDVPAGVTQEESHTGVFIHLLSVVHVRALIFLARRIQPFLSLVDREVEFCVLTIESFSTRWAFLFLFFSFLVRTRCILCVLGAPPSCRRGGGVGRCSTERKKIEVGCI